jgi:segregation and condensation protein B
MTQGPADDAEPTVAAPAARDLRVVEALLFVSAEPVPEAVLADRLPESADLAAILAELAGHYADRGVNLVRIGDGWALRTAPDLAGLLRRESDVQRRLSRAAIETVAIIAYHQPVTRAEIEQIRGVAVSKGTLDTLFECGWVQPRGRRRTPGRPATWVTSPGFLDHFGLVGLDDLPGLEELRASGLLDARPGPAVLSLGGDDDLDEEITHSELGQASEDPAADELAEDDVADGEPKARARSNPNEAEAEVDYDDQAVSLGRVGARR